MYFIANFNYLSDQRETEENNRRHGSFSMVVQTETTEQALDHFRRRLLRFRAASTLFSGRCSIYITQLLEFERFPEDEAVLLNFKSFAGDPIMPFIACTVPTEQSNACHIHEWENNQPVTEGKPDSLFIEFDG